MCIYKSVVFYVQCNSLLDKTQEKKDCGFFCADYVGSDGNIC